MPASRKFIRLERAALVPLFVVLLVVFPPTALRGDVQNGSVSGIVYGFTCGGSLVPLTGATVVATLIQTGYTSQPVTTGPIGSFNLTLAPGEYKLFVTADFFKTQDSYSFTIVSGIALRDFNFYLDSKTSTYCQIIPYQNQVDTFAVYSNASTGNIAYDSNKRMINLTISIANASVARFLIVVPRFLIDGAPVILADNVEVASILIEGANYYFVKFEWSPGSHNVAIRGSMAIPEIMPAGQLLATIFSLVLTVLVVSDLKSRARHGASSVTCFLGLRVHDNPSIIGHLRWG